MDELEEKLNSVLNNPKMMQQILEMAQNMSAPPPQKSDTPTQKGEGAPELDLGMLQKISGLARQGSIDRNQQALLKALGPYLSKDRIAKLEKAMRAAKIAKIASGFLGSGQPQLQSGR